MNITLLSFFAGIFLFICSFIGSLLIICINTFSSKSQAVCYSIAASIMISCSTFGLLAPSFDKAQNLNQNAFLVTTIGFIFGVFIILALDILLTKLNSKSSKEYLVPLSICLHNIPEGLIVGVGFGLICYDYSSLSSAILLMIAIGVQNIPEGLCTSIPIYLASSSKKKAIITGVLCSSVEVFSCLFATLFTKISNNLLPFLLAFASGAMIIISVSELLTESFKNHKILSSIIFTIFFILMFILEKLF